MRSTSPEKLNYFINHSSIYPNIAPDGTGYLDASDLLGQSDTYFFIINGVGILFWREEGGFKSDIYALPRKRGATAKRAYEKALKYMFEVTDKILVEAPAFNKASRHFIGSLGFKRTGIKPGAWVKDGVSYDVITYELEI